MDNKDNCDLCMTSIQRIDKCCHSAPFGPTIDEVLAYLFTLLTSSSTNIKKWGLVHGPIERDVLTEKEDIRTKTKKPDEFDMGLWLTCEYEKLACEVTEKGLNINEPDRGDLEPGMYKAREFVLNRLAELMEMKQKLEEDLQK